MSDTNILHLFREFIVSIDMLQWVNNSNENYPKKVWQGRDRKFFCQTRHLIPGKQTSVPREQKRIVHMVSHEIGKVYRSKTQRGT